jgi:amino acid adenylation domain-containing protein
MISDGTRHGLDGVELFPLSQGQLSFWLSQMLNLDDPAFNVGECIEIAGAIDEKCFEQALRRAVEVTDTLHLQFIETDDGPRQYFRHYADWELIHVDLTAVAEPDEAANTWIQKNMSHAFRLDEGPLYRFALLKLSSDRYFWYAINHHIINDGIGASLFLARVAKAYTAMTKGIPVDLHAVGSWRELLAEEQAYRRSAHYQRDQTFWKTQLSKRPPRVTLSGRPARRPLGFVKSIGWIPRSLNLDEAGRPHRTTAAAILLAATAIYLHRVTGARDITLLMPVSARIGPKMRSIIGMAANAVPLRLAISPENLIGDVIQRAAQKIQAALRHQRYRYEDLRRDLGFGPRDGEIAGTHLNFTPIDNNFKFANAKIHRNPLSNWWVEDLQIIYYGCNHPLGARIDFIANSAHYRQAEVDAHCTSFIEFLNGILSLSPDEPVSSVEVPAVPSRTTIELPATIEPQSTQSGTTSQRARHAGPPSTATEISLAEIWRDVLHIRSVDRSDDFFDIGGDSLLANILITRARKTFQLDLPLSVAFESSTLESLAHHIDVAAKKKCDVAPRPAIIRIADDNPAPLSFSQHRMWLIHALDPSNSAYNMSGATRLIGKLDINALSQAIDTLRRRHEILRTTYVVADEEVVQRVHEWKSEPLQIVDLTQDCDAPKEEAVHRANVAAASPIDLAKGPVFNCVLMRLGPEEHVLQTTVHHIAGDQWSFGVLGRELAALYNAARSGHTLNLPPHQIRYRDFAHWQQGWLKGPEMASHLQYWRRTLQNVTPLNLPTDQQRPRIQSLKGTFCLSRIPSGLIEKLEQLGRRESTTLFMTMFAGFLTLLHRLSNQTDIVAGVPVANRTHSAVEKIVGTFVNTLAFRVDLSNDPTFSDLLDRVRAVALDAFAHQDVPFDKLVQEILPTRDSSRPPLVQVMFNMLNAPMHGIELDCISWEPILIDRGGSQFELSMSVDCQVSQTVTVEYNSDLFERSTIEHFIERYLHILEAVVASPQTKLSEIDILPPNERRLLLKTWNATNVPAPRQSFIETFEARAAQLENTTAVTFEDNTLTYGELNSRANALAHELRALGADKGSIIGVCLERSLDMLVALLAVQKSGGAYVPLDPRLPERRLEHMVADSGLSLIIATEDLLERLVLPNDVQVVDPRSSIADQEPPATPNPERHVSSSDPAYIIYTSGSTGKPKAVVVSHGALSNLLCAMKKRPGLQATDVMAAVTTISFDIAGLELYLPLLVGARIELIATATASDAHALSQHLDRSGATVMQATPATWRMLLDAGWKGGTHFRAFCGGETLPRELANTLIEHVSELWNLYGPTETTIWSTAGLVQPGDDPISIGKPIDNTRVYILDSDTPVPIGITGEICIAGNGVATGYQGQTELTAARFGRDPFVEGVRGYRTGDLGRWGNDGQLYHMGRMDHQVKVRGFRIELGEIETVLRTHPAVREAIIVSREVGPSDSRLVAYVVYEGNHGPTTSEVRRYLRQQLPDYMVPSLFVTLDRLPLTSNGKIDRNILPDPFAGASEPSSVRDVPAPGNEALIADIWREMLKIDRVTAEDNFFDLGGHSLLALRVVAQIEKRTGTRLDPRVLFFQNLRQIAASLSDVEVCH